MIYYLALFLETLGHKRECFSSILAFYLVAQFMSAPIINLVNLYEKQKRLFLFNLQRLVLIFLIFLISYYMNLDINYTVFLFSIVIGLHYSLIVVYLLRMFKDV